MSKGAYTRQVNGGMNTRRGTPRAKLCKSASGRQRVLVRIVNPGCAASAILTVLERLYEPDLDSAKY